MGSDQGIKQQGERRFFSGFAKKLNVFLVAVIIGLCLYIQKSSNSSSHHRGNNGLSSGGGGQQQCAMSFGSYYGHVYNSKESGTLTTICLVQNKWIRLSQHKVQMPGSKTIIDDWLWIDYHDRINVLVEAPEEEATTEHHLKQERMFLIFEQSKYALEGRMSKAIIGGIIEPGEDPQHAAAREVEEEMGLRCTDLHFLGRFRTDVNRGMGWVNSFLATKCSKIVSSSEGSSSVAAAAEVGAADTERQKLKAITLTELRQAASAGEFLEVQWSATVSLALLHPELME